MTTFIVHNIEHAIDALRIGHESQVKVALQNPPSSHAYLGIPYILNMYQQAALAMPHVPHTTVLDIGCDAQGFFKGVMAGVRTVIFRGNTYVYDRLSTIGKAHDTRVMQENSGPVLDLCTLRNPKAQAVSWVQELKKAGVAA